MYFLTKNRNDSSDWKYMLMLHNILHITILSKLLKVIKLFSLQFCKGVLHKSEHLSQIYITSQTTGTITYFWTDFLWTKVFKMNTYANYLPANHSAWSSVNV